jgi:FG-GAP-like repeat
VHWKQSDAAQSIAIAIASVVLGGQANGGDGVFPGRSWQHSPTEFAAGDVDLDGDADLVVGVTNGFVTLRNEGSGVYTPLAPSNVGTTPGNVVLAQLDSDGKLDVVFGTLTGVFASAGNGFGAFAAPIQLLVGFQSGTPRVGDVNEDGHPDVVVGSNGAGFTVIFGTGAGPTTPQLFIAGGGSGSNAELVDLNGDSHLDVITVGSWVNAWLGNGAGQFTLAGSWFAAAGVTSFVHGDFDQDQIRDLLVFTLFQTTAQFWKGNPNGTFTGPLVNAVPNGAYRVFDFDQDGLQDLAGGDSNLPGRLLVRRGIGGAMFAIPIDIPVEIAVSRVFPHDADSDGDLDLFVGGNVLTLLECEGAGDYAVLETLTFIDPADLATGDVNDDGWDDLVAVRYQSQLATSVADSAGEFASFVTSGAVGAGNGVRLELGDLDLDGDLDAVVGTTVDLRVFHGTGMGGFSSVQSVHGLGFVTPSRMALDDADGDGLNDVLLLTTGPGPFGLTISEVKLALGATGGMLGAITSLHSATTTAQDMHVADLNNDGAADVAFAFDSVLSLALTNGLGGFSPVQPITWAGNVVRAIDSGDVEADGDRDLVVLDGGSGGIRPLLQSSGSFTLGPAAATLLSAQNPAALRISDVNGDGKLDATLLGSPFSQSSSLLEVFAGTGIGAFGPPVTHSLAAPVTAMTNPRVFDGDHDGRADVVFASGERDHVEIARNTRPSFFDYRGAGCPGSGGFTPRLRLDGAATPAGVVTLSIANGLGGATAMLFTGLQFASVPLPGGCPLLTFPLLPIVFNLPLSGVGAGKGDFAFGGVLPGSLGFGSSYVFQVLVVDPGAPFGFAATNAVKLTVQ